jgi:hypothetical protein
MISEGDLFAIVIGPSSLVVDGDVTFADDLIKALLDSDATPLRRCCRRSRPPGCSAWMIWSRSSMIADGGDAREAP